MTTVPIDLTALPAAQVGAVHYALRVRSHLQDHAATAADAITAGMIDAHQGRAVAAFLEVLDGQVLADVVALTGIELPEDAVLGDITDVTDDPRRAASQEGGPR